MSREIMDDVMEELGPAMKADTELSKEFFPDKLQFYQDRMHRALHETDPIKRIEILRAEYKAEYNPDAFKQKFELGLSNYKVQHPYGSEKVYRDLEIRRLERALLPIEEKFPDDGCRFESVVAAKSYIEFIRSGSSEQTEKQSSQPATDWGEILKTLPHGCIDAGQEDSLLAYLKNGVAKHPIKIKNRKFAIFYRWIEPLWGVIPRTYHTSIYDSIHENFINYAGNKIPMTTISSQKNSNNL